MWTLGILVSADAIVPKPGHAKFGSAVNLDGLSIPTWEDSFQGTAAFAEHPVPEFPIFHLGGRVIAHGVVNEPIDFPLGKLRKVARCDPLRDFLSHLVRRLIAMYASV